jgi:enediyne polyketide synthase
MGLSVQVRRRPDGKPETDSGTSVSSAHCGQLTFAIAGTGTLSCDAELVVERDVAVWKDLLGESCFALAERIARETDEDMDHACTRTWAAVENLKKVGRRQPLSIVLESIPAPNWAILSDGDLTIATYCCRVSARPEPVVLAILTGN